MKHIEIDGNKIIGTFDKVTDYLRRCYILSVFKTTDEDRYRYTGVSQLNDIRIFHGDGQVCKFWAGVSGCNWNMIDQWGGNHDLAFYRDKVMYVLIEDVEKAFRVDKLILSEKMR